MEFKKVAVGYPCCNYLVKKLTTMESLWYYCKIFSKTAYERGLSCPDILTHLIATLNNLSIDSGLNCPNFNQYGNTPEDICNYLINNPSVPAAKQCHTYYRTIDSHTGACRICKYSKLYRNENEDMEYAILKYMLEKEDNLNFVASHIQENFFVSSMDVSISIPVAKAYIIPMPKILMESLLKDNIRLILFSSIKDNFMIQGEPFDLVWEDAYRTFPKKRKIPVNLSNNPMWQSALKSEVKTRIISAKELTREELASYFESIVQTESAEEINSTNTQPAYISQPLEDIIVDLYKEPQPKERKQQSILKNKTPKEPKNTSVNVIIGDKSLKNTSTCTQANTPSDSNFMPSISEPTKNAEEHILPHSPGKAEDIPIKDTFTNGVQIVASEQTADDVVEVEESEQFEDNNLAVSPIKEYDEESELDDEIIDWGIADADSADIEYEIPETFDSSEVCSSKEETVDTSQQSSDSHDTISSSNVSSDVFTKQETPKKDILNEEQIVKEDRNSFSSLPQTKKEEIKEEIKIGEREIKDTTFQTSQSAITPITDVNVDKVNETVFLSEVELLKIENMNLILLPVLADNCRKDNMIHIRKNKTLPEAFYHGVLRSKLLFIEVVRATNGTYLYLIWSTHMKKFITVSLEEAPDSLKKLLSHKSITKVCHTPYLLYGTGKLFRYPIRNVFSLQSVHGRLFINEPTLYYKDLCNVYVPTPPKCDFLPVYTEQCPFLSGMPCYETIYRLLNNMILASSNYSLFLRDALLDEALGCSYFYGLNFMDKGVLLLLIGNHKIYYKKEFSRVKTTEGRYVSYYVKEKVNAIFMFHFLLQRLAEKGLFRSCNIQILGMDRRNLNLYVGKEQEEYILSQIDLFIFEYGRTYLKFPFQVHCFKSEY